MVVVYLAEMKMRIKSSEVRSLISSSSIVSKRSHTTTKSSR